MHPLKRVLGAFLIGLSVLAVAQTIRELMLWKAGQRRYVEEHPLELPIIFAGNTFSVRDDQPFTRPSSETEVEGAVQPLLNGQPLGPVTRARVRPGRAHDLGRYHLWYDATIFQDRATGERTLWLTRRVQPTADAAARFEVTVVGEEGELRTRVLSAWRLGSEFRLFRATQLLREGTWTTMPFSLGDVLGVFPPLLIIFPIGTFLLGLRLVWRNSTAALRRVNSRVDR